MRARPALLALAVSALCVLGACARGNTIAGGVGRGGGSGAAGHGGAEGTGGTGGATSTSQSSTSSSTATTTTSTGQTTMMCGGTCEACTCPSPECSMCCAYKGKVDQCVSGKCFCY